MIIFSGTRFIFWGSGVEVCSLDAVLLQSQSFGGQILDNLWDPQNGALLHLGLLRSVQFHEEKMTQRQGPQSWATTVKLCR